MGGPLSRRKLWVVGCAVTCGLIGSTLPAVTADAASRISERSSGGRLAVPALVSADGIRARLPQRGVVGYRLPPLPDGGVRVLGDWNHDGVQTAGVFAGGVWQLWNQVQRTTPPAVTATFGQPGDVPVTGDWNGDGTTDIGVVRGAEWRLALGPLPADGSAPGLWRDLTFGD